MANMKREDRLASAGSPVSQQDYERVLDEVATLRMRKVRSYGEKRYRTELSDTGRSFDMTMTFSDIYRKYIRIEEAVLNGKYDDASDGESLRDAFADLANYALMGVQLCDKHGIGKAAGPASYENSVPNTVSSKPPAGYTLHNDVMAATTQYIDIVLDGLPITASPPFAQAETDKGQSIRLEWVEPDRNRHYWTLRVPVRVMSEPQQLRGCTLDQVAIYTNDTEDTKHLLEQIFGGLLVWHEDHVSAHGEVWGAEGCQNEADLSFNYDLVKNGVEFEVLHYTDGDDWHMFNGEPSRGMSHLGMHVEDVNPWKKRMARLGFDIAQEVITDSHTNPKIKDSRRYHYVIFNTVKRLGFYLKLIERKRMPVELPKLAQDLD